MTADIRAAVVDQPWRAVAVAFATGAYLGFMEPRGRIGRAIAGTVAAFALAAIREAAGRHLATQARSWVDARAN